MMLRAGVGQRFFHNSHQLQGQLGYLKCLAFKAWKRVSKVAKWKVDMYLGLHVDFEGSYDGLGGAGAPSRQV